jgi:HEAT repeat protein
MHLRFALLFPMLAVMVPLDVTAFDWPGRIDLLADGLESQDPEARRRTIERLGTYPPEHVSDYLMSALEDEDRSVRIAASRIVGRGRMQRAAPMLVGWLTEREDELRVAACIALGRIGDPSTVPSLTRVASDTVAEVRQAAVEALAAIGTPDVQLPLIGRLGDSHPRVRQAAAEGLGQIASREAVVPLVSRLQDPVRSVRLAVIVALARIGDARAASPLIQALSDPSPEVRAAVLTALTRIRSDEMLIPVIDLLDDEDENVRVRAVAALGAIGGDRALQELVRCLGNGTLTRPAMDALVAVGPPAVRPLTEVLRRGSDQQVRAAALHALTVIADPVAADAIIEELEIGTGLPEDSLVLALGSVVSERGLMPLLSRLEHDDPGVRVGALVALAGHVTSGDVRSGEALVQRLDAPSSPERVLALLLLARIGEPRAAPRAIEIAMSADRDTGLVEQVLGRISSPSWMTAELSSAVATRWPERVAAIRALGATDDPSVAGPLLELLDERHASLRYEAALALGRLGGGQVVSSLVARLASQEPVDRAAVVHALGMALATTPSNAGRQALETLLERSETSLALRAADALARAGDAAAAPAVARLLLHPDVALRRKAAEVLGELPCDASREALIQALADDDPMVRGLALWSLGKVGGPDVVRLAIEHLEDESWSVGVNAAGVLARLADPESGGAVCSALAREQRSPHAWSNLLVASGTTGAECAGPRALEAFRGSQLPLVRAASVRVMGRLARGQDAGLAADVRRLLGTCEAEDPNSDVRSACADAMREPPAGDGGREWLEFYLYAADRRRIRAQGRFLLILPDGLVKAGITDGNGFAREAPVSAGSYRVEEPGAGPRSGM